MEHVITASFSLSVKEPAWFLGSQSLLTVSSRVLLLGTWKRMDMKMRIPLVGGDFSWLQSWPLLSPSSQKLFCPCIASSRSPLSCCWFSLLWGLEEREASQYKAFKCLHWTLGQTHTEKRCIEKTFIWVGRAQTRYVCDGSVHNPQIWANGNFCFEALFD